jgi:hypothetical protein
MKNSSLTQTLTSIFLMIPLLFCSDGYAENIDPNDDDTQYAYGGNVGWFNAEPNGDGEDGVEVADADLTGYIWAENIGWISLSCENTSAGEISQAMPGERTWVGSVFPARTWRVAARSTTGSLFPLPRASSAVMPGERT